MPTMSGLPYLGPDPAQPTPAFWQLIDLARTDARAAQARVVAMDRVGLVAFYWAFHDAAELLREQAFEDEARLPSEDGVDDAIVWAVAQGEAVYREVLAGRRRLPNAPGRFKDLMGAVARQYQKVYRETLPYPEDLSP
jgi:hypothetical protein